MADPSSAAAARPGNRSAATAAGVLGFALGGVSDGIMLHQVQQWHHFLSRVTGEALRDIRAQILAGGLFLPGKVEPGPGRPGAPQRPSKAAKPCGAPRRSSMAKPRIRETPAPQAA